MPLDAVEASWNSGGLHVETTMCKVGDAIWISVSKVFGPSKPKEVLPLPSPGRAPAEVASGTVQHPAQSKPLIDSKPKPRPSGASTVSRSSLEGRYENLTGVGRGLATYGGLLKVVGWVLIIGGLGAAFILFSSGAWMAALGFLGFLTGIVLHVAGTLLAALGEGLLALSDIAVSTWITAEHASGGNP